MLHGFFPLVPALPDGVGDTPHALEEHGVWGRLSVAGTTWGSGEEGELEGKREGGLGEVGKGKVG